MEMNEYQQAARKTAIYPKEYQVVYPALGLLGESGELLEKISSTHYGPDSEDSFLLQTLRVLGQAGKVAECLKKYLRDGQTEKHRDLLHNAIRGVYIESSILDDYTHQDPEPNDFPPATPPQRFHIDLMMELGDVTWYVANLAEDMGMTLDQVTKLNVAKLESRQARGTLQGSGDNR